MFAFLVAVTEAKQQQQQRNWKEPSSLRQKNPHLHHEKKTHLSNKAFYHRTYLKYMKDTATPKRQLYTFQSLALYTMEQMDFVMRLFIETIYKAALQCFINIHTYSYMIIL